MLVKDKAPDVASLDADLERIKTHITKSRNPTLTSVVAADVLDGVVECPAREDEVVGLTELEIWLEMDEEDVCDVDEIDVEDVLFKLEMEEEEEEEEEEEVDEVELEVGKVELEELEVEDVEVSELWVEFDSTRICVVRDPVGWLNVVPVLAILA